MLFNSLSYLLFFPTIVLAYFLLPHQARPMWLLAASYFFYMCWNAEYALLLLGCTVVTYLCGRLTGLARQELADGKPRQMRRTGNPKTYVAVSFVLGLGMLAWFKYANFVMESLRGLASLAGWQLNVPQWDIVLPVGISFYLFQALGYTVDVYRGKVPMEKNFLRYALFVSFFPQLEAGPIGRADQLLPQFSAHHTFEPERVCRGLMLMLWGYFQKVVIADHAALLANQVFNYYTSYTGFEIALGAAFFAVQIYCDFAGYTNIAIGSAQVLGFDLMQNFREPYLARSVAEFWRRWHISLTSWFRDYLYIPLGGSRRGTLRKYCNVMLVFLVSGLWHGAAWTFVIWGGLNGLFQVLGSLLAPARKRALAILHVNPQSFGHKLLQTLLTFCLVDLAWIFFRADTVQDAFAILERLFGGWNPWILFDGTLYTLGLNALDFWITAAAIGVLLAVDLLHRRGVRLRAALLRQSTPVRWAVCYAALFAILIFGSYGPAYQAASFIYLQF